MKHVQIFDGIKIKINKSIQTQNDLNILTAYIEYYGGQLVQVDQDFTISVEYNHNDQFQVLPHYIEDCVRFQQLLPFDEYLLPDPQLLSIEAVTTQQLQSKLPSLLKPLYEINGDFNDFQWISGKKFYFCQSLSEFDQITKETVSKCSDLISQHGGIVYNQSSNEIDFFISNIKNKDQIDGNFKILTLFELVYLMFQKDSTVKLPYHLLQPIKNDNKDFSAFCISLTNYIGQSRDILKYLTKACGSSYFSSLDKQVNLLIAASPVGEKYEAALKWGINIVNHLWLTDSAINGRPMPFTDLKYQIYNAPITLNLIVSQAIQNCKGKEDIPTIKENRSQLDVCQQVQVSKETQENSIAQFESTVEYLPPEILATQQKRKIVDDEESVTTMSLNAPMREIKIDEVRRLSSQKRVKSNPSSVKKTNTSLEDFEIENVPFKLEEEKRSLMKPVSKNPLAKIIFTGIGKPNNLQKFLSKLHVVEVDDISQATHLITNRIARTEKFMCGVAYCKYIVTDKWLLDSITANKLQDEQEYILKDPENEKLFNFSLANSLIVSKQKKLFHGLKFLCTKSVLPQYKTMKKIVDAHGGILINSDDISLQNIQMDVIIVTCDQDQDVWNQYRQRGLALYYSELILVGSLTQKLEMQTYKIRNLKN